MPDIKTRDTAKGTIKTLDKAAVAGERMKEAYVRTKEKAEHGVYTSEPEESGSTESDGNNILIAYSNIKNGTLISKDMGIDKILAECPHFREWIEQISYLGA